MVQKSGIIKDFLQALTPTIFYANTARRFQKICFPENRAIVLLEISLEIFKYKVVVYDLFRLCGNYYHSLSRAK